MIDTKTLRSLEEVYEEQAKRTSFIDQIDDLIRVTREEAARPVEFAERIFGPFEIDAELLRNLNLPPNFRIIQTKGEALSFEQPALKSRAEFEKDLEELARREKELQPVEVYFEGEYSNHTLLQFGPTEITQEELDEYDRTKEIPADITTLLEEKGFDTLLFRWQFINKYRKSIYYNYDADGNPKYMRGGDVFCDRHEKKKKK